MLLFLAHRDIVYFLILLAYQALWGFYSLRAINFLLNSMK